MYTVSNLMSSCNFQFTVKISNIYIRMCSKLDMLADKLIFAREITV